MAVEPKRGCGYRKVGGLYLVGDGASIACDRLPFPLTVCPVCSCGIKQTRGWTWVRVAELLGGKHEIPGDDIWPESVSCKCSPACPVCAGTIERGGLVWIGEKFYPTPYAFEDEARRLGISRRISAIPRGFKIGDWVLLAHPKALIGKVGETVLAVDRAQDDVYGPIPGIFRVWRPTAIEKIVTESSRGSEEVAALEKAGITAVFVPDDDADHRGSVHDKDEVDEQPELADRPANAGLGAPASWVEYAARNPRCLTPGQRLGVAP